MDWERLRARKIYSQTKPNVAHGSKLDGFRRAAQIVPHTVGPSVIIDSIRLI